MEGETEKVGFRRGILAARRDTHVAPQAGILQPNLAAFTSFVFHLA